MFSIFQVSQISTFFFLRNHKKTHLNCFLHSLNSIQANTEIVRLEIHINKMSVDISVLNYLIVNFFELKSNCNATDVIAKFNIDDTLFRFWLVFNIFQSKLSENKQYLYKYIIDIVFAQKSKAVLIPA